MLRQILRDMYVDPEILAELPEEQREMLFFKIRQEQVRRYNDREKSKSSPLVKHRRGTKVRILEDSRGEPWTWVFGECPGETTVEEKWKRLSEKRMQEAIRAVVKEEQQRSRKTSAGKKVFQQGEQQDERTRKTSNPRRAALPQLEQDKKLQKISSAKKFVVIEREEAKRKISMPAKLETAADERSKQNFLRIRQTRTVRFSPNSSPTASPEVSPINPRRAAYNKSPNPSPVQSPIVRKSKKETIKSSPGSYRRITDEVDGLSKQGPNGRFDVDQEDRAAERKRRDQLSYYDNVELKDHKDDVISNEEWKSQLKRFKEADERRSAMARRASLEYQRQLMLAKEPKNFRDKIRSKLNKLGGIEKREQDSKPLLPPRPEGFSARQTIRNGKPSRPQTRKDVKDWFEETQLQILTDEEFIGIPGWFHGIISRPETEDLLRNKPKGYFLIRVSDKIWGYTLSYKDDDRIKHFLIDASIEHCYFLFGNDQVRHDSLKELLEYHKVENISLHEEKLRNWVGQSNPKKPDYAELLPKSNNKIEEISREFKSKLK